MRAIGPESAPGRNGFEAAIFRRGSKRSRFASRAKIAALRRPSLALRPPSANRPLAVQAQPGPWQGDRH